MINFTNKNHAKNEMVRIFKNYWLVLVCPKKYMKKPYYIFVSAGNIIHYSQEFVSFRYYKFFIFPSEIKLYYSNIDSAEGYIKRTKPLSDLEFMYIKDEHSLTHRKQAFIAGCVKWATILLLVGLIIAIITTLAVTLG